MGTNVKWGAVVAVGIAIGGLIDAMVLNAGIKALTEVVAVGFFALVVAILALGGDSTTRTRRK